MTVPEFKISDQALYDAIRDGIAEVMIDLEDGRRIRMGHPKIVPGVDGEDFQIVGDVLCKLPDSHGVMYAD